MSTSAIAEGGNKVTEYLFHLKNGHARPMCGDFPPTDQVLLRLEGGVCGSLFIGGERIAITEKGAHIHAKRLPSGVHTLRFLVGEKRYEGPSVAIFGNTVFLLPPSHAQLAHAEARIEALEDENRAFEKRLAAIEGRIQDTHIF